MRLLSELMADGVFFFASIDDNEAHHFRCMLDEIFGESKALSERIFVANIAWQKRTSPEARKQLGAAFDTLLVFQKRGAKAKLSKLSRSADQEADFENPDNDPRGPWTSTDFTGQNPDPEKRVAQQYKIQLPNGDWVSPPRGRCWAALEPEFMRMKSEGRIWFGTDSDSRPRVKHYLHESDGVSSWTWRPNEEVGHNQEAKKEIQAVFEEERFDYPKPLRLIRRILDLALSQDGLILDSFAGSGTTAHAVLEANKRDGGNRRFILVEMEDYADRLTAERVRRVIKGYDFTGTQKTELLREKLNWRVLEKADALRHKVEAIENLHGHEYDRIKKDVEGGELIVTGEKSVAERTEGLGGEFTYCTLGEPVELDRILKGDGLPSFSALGAVLFHMATSQVADEAAFRPEDFHIGLQGDQMLWLIYRPDLAWLQSAEAALTLSFATRIHKAHPDKRHIVFAPARHASRRVLDQHRLNVEFAPLPFALYRVERV